MSTTAIRRAAIWALVVWAAAVAYLTLLPGRPGDLLSIEDFFCIWCSSRPGADRILNVLLFVPAGLLLRLLIGGRATILVAVAMTVGIESAQVVIPGRHPSLADLITNTGGAGIGAWLATWPPRRVLALGGAGATAAWLLPAVLLSPKPSSATLFALWNPDFPGRPVYAGSVLAVGIGGIPVSGRLEASETVREALVDRSDIELTFVAAPETAVPTSLFGIYDEDQQENLLVAVRGDDVMISRRSRGAALGLDQPEHLAANALEGVAAGDTISLTVAHTDGRWCLGVEGRRDCRLSPSQASGWAFLLYSEGTSTFVRGVLSGAWALVLGVLIGAAFPGWMRGLAAGALIGGAGAATAAVAPELTPALGPCLLLFFGTLSGTVIRAPLLRVGSSAREGMVGLPVGSPDDRARPPASHGVHPVS